MTVKVNGRLELVSMQIDPKLVADGDAELLEDLVVAAVNAGLAKARDTGGPVAGLLDRRFARPGLPDRRAESGRARREVLIMAGFSAAVDRLVAALGRLPGIGAKSAERLATISSSAPPKRLSSSPTPSARPSSRSGIARSAFT